MIEPERAPSSSTVCQLHRQLNALIVLLTVVELTGEVISMLDVLAETATAALPTLSSRDPAVLVELASAFENAQAGRCDDTRAALLMASRRLAVLRRVDRQRPIPTTEPVNGGLDGS